jgi:cobalt-zinc-cadmium efflux system protein
MNTACKHHHHSSKTETHKRALFFAVLIAFVFMVIEIAGGKIAKSLALMSDALHLFADVGALCLSWIAAHLMQKPATKSLSFGYKRTEVLGAFASALMLWALCGVLGFESIYRIFEPEPVHGGVVFVVAALGLVANFAMFKFLHPTRKDNLNMKAAYLHVIGDLLNSIGVLLAGAIIYFTGWNLADPIITLVFTAHLFYSSGKVLWRSLAILMESTPPGIEFEAIQAALRALPQVDEVHDLHIWSLSTNDHALSVHLVTKDPTKTLKEAHEMIEKRFGIVHMTIQVEDHDHFDPKYCYDCQKKS